MDALRTKTDSKCTRCLSCFGCRRRTLYHKLSPLIIQITIVTLVWLLVKRWYANATIDDVENNISLRSIKSSDDQVNSICSHQEYNNGLALSLKDIVSASGSSEKRFFLQVDVLTRDSEHDVPTLYTAGTTVIMDGFMEDEIDIDDDNDDDTDDEDIDDDDNDNEGTEGNVVDKKEFYYDSGVEEKDLDTFSASVVDATKGDTQNDGDYHENDDNDTWGTPGVKIETSSTLLPNNVNNGPNQNQGTGTILENNAGQMPSQLNNGPLQSSSNSQNAHIPTQQGQFDGGLMQSKNNIPPQSPQQMQANLNFQPQNGNLALPGQLNGAGQQMHQQPNQMNANIGIGLQPHNSNQQVSGNNENNEAKSEQAGINSNDGVIPGFRERLAAFKTEYYGRPVSDSSEQRKPSFAFNNPTLCENLEKVDVLYLIHTIPQSNEQRQRIRNTFAKSSLFEPYSVAHVFIVGLTSSPNFQANLDNEHEQYNDIIQGEFNDNPESRTMKGLLGFRWVTNFCSKAKFVLKINEDVFVDTDKLLQGLIPAASGVVNKKAIMCYLVQNAPIPRSGPNAFDHDVFPKSSRMRPHCKGFAVLTTVQTLSALVTASEHVPVFQFDDLYLFGALPFVAGELDVYDLGNKRAFHDFGMAVVKCYKDQQDKCPFVATKAFSARFTSLWEFVSARKAPESPVVFQGDPSLWKLEEYKSSFEV